MRISVVGATGLVGSKMLQVLEERDFPVTELILAASEKSVGKQISFRGNSYTVVTIADAVAARPDIALFSAGGSVSLEWAPIFAQAGTKVIDNSSAWRMNPDNKLIVPEVNGDVLGPDDYIIANPNCSTIQMVMVLSPLDKLYQLQRVVVSTYQSVSGSGQKGLDHLAAEQLGGTGDFYPHPIHLNVLPHIDSFMPDGYTKEERKMINETQKILGNPNIKVSATAVRVPVIGGHSESVNMSFLKEYDIQKVREVLDATEGITVVDDPAQNQYPLPIHAHDHDDVFVGRIRRDESYPHTLNCWIVSDNLRKGAATNAVQIAEYLVAHQLV